MALPPPSFPTADLFASPQPFATRGGTETGLIELVYRLHLTIDKMKAEVVEQHVNAVLARHPACVYVDPGDGSGFVPLVTFRDATRFAVPIIGSFAEPGDDIDPDRSAAAIHRIHPLACNTSTSFLATTDGLRRVFCAPRIDGFVRVDHGRRVIRVVDLVPWKAVNILKLLLLWRVDILSQRLTQDPPTIPAVIDFLRSALPDSLRSAPARFLSTMAPVVPMRPIRVAPVAAIVRVDAIAGAAPPPVDGLTIDELTAVFPPCVREVVVGFLRGVHFPKYKDRFQLWLMCAAAGITPDAMRTYIERALRSIPHRYSGPLDGYVRSFLVDYERVVSDSTMETMTKRCTTRVGLQGVGACSYANVTTAAGVRAHTSSHLGFLVECDIEDLLVHRKHGKPVASGLCACVQRVDAEQVRGAAPIVEPPRMPQDYIHAMRGRITKGAPRIIIKYN